MLFGSSARSESGRRAAGLGLAVGLAASAGMAAAEDFSINTLTAEELDAILHHDPFANLPAGFAGSLSIESIDGVAVVAGTIGQLRETETFFVQAAVSNVLTEGAIDRRNTISGSFDGNRGIVSVNQDTGAANSQANLRSISLGLAGEGADLQDAEIWGVQVLGGNRLTSAGGAQHNVIEASFNGVAGIVGVNQAAGSLNLQANTLALAVGMSSGPEALALNDVTLAQISGDNELEVDDTAPRSNTIEDSFNDFSGIAQVNQAAGFGNVVGQNIGITASIRRMP